MFMKPMFAGGLTAGTIAKEDAFDNPTPLLLKEATSLFKSESSKREGTMVQ